MLKVLLPLPTPAMSYLPPHDQEARLGVRVVVPWRGELRTGVVVALEEQEKSTYHLRSAVAYLDQTPWLRPLELDFLQQAALQNFCPPGVLLADLVPYLEPALVHQARLLPGTSPEVLPAGMQELVQWQEARGFDPKLLDLLRESGVLQEEVHEHLGQPKVLVALEPVPGLSSKGQTAWAVLQKIGHSPSMSDLARQAGVGTGIIKTLLEKGAIAWQTRELPLDLPPARPLEALPLPEIPARVHGGRFMERMRLLSGVVADQPALVLFPEVALLKRVQAFVPQALPFHGEMSPELRRQVFKQVLAPGFAGVVLATYQGLMLPFTPQRLVVFEEGSDAYKLAAGSRAHLVRLAELRARQLEVPLTYLGQTPSPEALQVPGLVFPLPAPRLHLLDLNHERGWPLTGAALALLRQAQEKNRQAVVVVPRRGYSAVLRCKHCDWKAMCPNCALPLRLHRSGRYGLLQCHQCGHTQDAPPVCPSCASDVFEPRGPGLEWLHDELKKHLPSFPLYRYSAEGKDDLGPLRMGQAGVLLGTTAVLRAPLLPELALVVLPFADGFKLGADYRSSERYHRLLWQLAELHPQRRPLLAVQTFEPQDPLYARFQSADAEGFAQTELALRQVLNYPPVTRLLKLEVSHPKEPQARDAALQLANLLKPVAQSGELLGPVAAPIPRVQGQYVFHLLLRGNTQRLQQLLEVLPHVRGAKLRYDPDPIGFVGLLED